ncbi:MAG: glycosyltransferase family 39 protein [Ruthenibacterium sp.]
MNEPVQSPCRAYRVLRRFFWSVGALLFLLLALFSLIVTTYYPPDYSETPWFSFSALLPVAFCAALCWVLLWLWDQKIGIERINLRILTVVMLVYTFIVPLLWVIGARDIPGADMAFVSSNAVQMLEGNYTLLSPTKYFSQFPFQLGISSLLAFFRVLFRDGYLFAYQVFNALCCPPLFLLCVKLTHLLFHSKKAEVLACLLCMCSLPVMLCCTLIYGTIVSILLCVFALYGALRAVRHDGKQWCFLSLLSIVLAVLLKPNSTVFLIGILLLFCFTALQNKSWRPLVWVIIFLVCLLFSKEALLRYYETKSGYDLHSGESQLAWVAMGLQEGPLAPGWFNFYVDTIYAKNNADAAAIKEQSLQSIRDSAVNFLRSPGYALRFFSAKLASEWCEPTYAGFWVSEPDEGQERSVSDTMMQLYYGTPHTVLVSALDTVQLLLFSGAACCLWKRRKTLSLAALTPVIIIAGGFLYHLIAEGKSLYILPYTVLLLPYAACGLAHLTEFTFKKRG